MADSYAEMDNADFAKLVMAPGDQTLLEKAFYIIKGIIFSIILVATALVGFTYSFFVCVTLLLLAPRLCMSFFNFVQVTWNGVVVVCLRCLYGCQYTHFGDTFDNSDRRILILANHRTNVDWLIILNFLFNHGKMGSTRFSIKAPLRHVPGVGWFLSIACHVFLKRQFEDDMDHIQDCLDMYQKTMDNVTFYLFPEGTVYWPHTIRKSNNYAEKAGVESYRHVLMPRTTGFKFLLKNPTYFDAVYDLTSIYEKHVPQSEPALYNGCMPPMTNVILKRFDIQSALKDPEHFLQNVWREKDEMIDRALSDDKYLEKQFGIHLYRTTIFENCVKFLGGVFWCWRVIAHLGNFWAFLPFLTVATITTLYLQKKYFSLSYCITACLKLQENIKKNFPPVNFL